VVAAK